MEKNSNLISTVAIAAGSMGLIFALIAFSQPQLDSSAETAELRAKVESMSTQMGQMRQQMTALSAQLAAGAGARTDAGPSVRRDVSQQQIDRMVGESLAKLASNPRGVPPSEGLTAEQQEQVAQQNLHKALAVFRDPRASDDAIDAAWEALKDAGLLEEAIAMLEDQAALDPNNESLQVQLGYGYLQPIIRGNVAGMEAGQWSMKADATFDRVLKLNPENWDARFSKAVSYSFWPPMFGKQKDAISNFEILIEQQASRVSDPKFAQTHLLLGNLYSQAGQTEKAQEAWSSGLARYPENAELRKQLGLE